MTKAATTTAASAPMTVTSSAMTETASAEALRRMFKVVVFTTITGPETAKK